MSDTVEWEAVFFGGLGSFNFRVEGALVNHVSPGWCVRCWVFPSGDVDLKDVRANCLCATFLSISSQRCVRVRELRARKICHAKVCKQIWRPLRKVKKEIKVGDS